MFKPKIVPALTLGAILSTVSAAADYKAGVARVIITPEQSMYLFGYAVRTHASEGKIHDLWAKAWLSRTARAAGS